MATSFTLTIDCGDADRMMQFWTTALGYKPKDPPEGFDDWCSYFRSIGVPEEELRGECATYLVDPEGIAPQIFLQEVPEPKVVKNRLHIDVTGDTGALLAAGATLLRRRGGDIRWDVLADPEGNEFCCFAP